MKQSVLPLISSLLLASPGFSQAAVIFYESMGAPASTTAVSAYETSNGYDNDGLTMSGTGDVRTSTPSGTYSGASGGGNVFLTNNGTASFAVAGIDTSAEETGTLVLTFGAYKSTIASTMSELTVEFSTNGTDWTPLSIPAQSTGSGTAVWRMLTVSNSNLIPSSASLQLRWTNSGTTPQFRIDDITLASVPEPSSALLGLMGAGLGIRRRGRHRQQA